MNEFQINWIEFFMVDNWDAGDSVCIIESVLGENLVINSIEDYRPKFTLIQFLVSACEWKFLLII